MLPIISTNRTSSPRPKAFAACLLLVLATSNAFAGQFYRWIDSSGNLYIGDQPPPDNATGAQALPLPEYAPPERSPQDDPYSILNQTKRLKEQREALARERLEQRRAEREYQLRKREREAMQEPPQQSNVPVYIYPQVHYGRPSFRPWHPKPGRPQHGPGDSHRPWPNNQPPGLHAPHAVPKRRLYIGR